MITDLSPIFSGQDLMNFKSYTYLSGFSLKHGTAAPRRGVKPANKVGAVNYKEPVTYKRTLVRCIHGTFLHRN